MSERITLSRYEYNEIEKALRKVEGASNPVELIGAVIITLNKLREPLPLRTVRVADDGSIAVKVGDLASDQWFVHRFDERCSGRVSDESVADWPIVHRPT